MTKNPFAKLPAEIQAKLLAADRMIPGYWSTAELTVALGLGRNAVFMRVKRGGLVPVDRKQPRAKLMFADRAVAEHLLNPPKRGRPVGRRQTSQVQNTDC